MLYLSTKNTEYVIKVNINTLIELKVKYLCNYHHGNSVNYDRYLPSPIITFELLLKSIGTTHMFYYYRNIEKIQLNVSLCGIRMSSNFANKVVANGE